MVSEQDKREFIKNFKRTLKTIKKSEFYFYCNLCNCRLDNTLFVVDSRNDKYCPSCANRILDFQINKLELLKKSLCNESILDELEEDELEGN